MEAIGTASAIADLAGLTIKTSLAAKRLVQSFLNAPAELSRLSAKLDRLVVIVNQIENLPPGLPVSGPGPGLLRAEHQVMLSLGLQKNLEVLRSIINVCDQQGGRLRDVENRLHWAVLGKKRAKRIVQDIRELEGETDLFINILSLRIATLNSVSLDALARSCGLFPTALKESTEDLKSFMKNELGSLIDRGGSGTVLTHESGPGFLASDKSPSNQLVQASNWGSQSQASIPVWPLSNSLRTRDNGGPGSRLIEHNMRRSLQVHSMTLGPSSILNDLKEISMGAHLTYASKRTRRRFRMVVNFGFKLFCQRILSFDLQVRWLSTHFTGTPRFNCSMAVFNLRPSDAPIFRAIEDRDFYEFRNLLESGQASIWDADAEIGGLMEHIVHREVIVDLYQFRQRAPLLASGQPLVEYLLDQGYDPNSFAGNRYGRYGRSAVWMSIAYGFASAASSMLSHGADLEALSTELAKIFMSTESRIFTWQVKLLRSAGFSDWNVTEPSDHLLSGACWAADLQEALFALEIVGIDPEIVGGHDRAAIGNAAQAEWVEGLAILIDFGANVNPGEATWNGTPLGRSFGFRGPMDAAHYLLLHGADPMLRDSWSASAWNHIWEIAFEHELPTRATGWSYIQLEGMLAHLLMHNADPFEIFHSALLGPDARGRPERLYDFVRQIRAVEVARAWSYNMKLHMFPSEMQEGWEGDYEAAESTRRPRFISEWSELGVMSAREPDVQLMGGDDQGDQQKDEPNNINEEQHLPRELEDEEFDGVSTDDNGDNDDLEIQSSGCDCYLCGLASRSTFFQKQTRFYHHAGTRQGRRQLDRFPLVRVLCDALQYAGYLAEMDDKGDIWFDPEDGDRYLDARETRPADSDAERPATYCAICQDFEGHGLGHVLARAEEGKRALLEYRENLQRTKRSYF